MSEFTCECCKNTFKKTNELREKFYEELLKDVDNLYYLIKEFQEEGRSPYYACGELILMFVKMSLNYDKNFDLNEGD